MAGGGRGPEAEAIVVLRREDHGPEAGFPGHPRPLPRIQPGGIEEAGALGSVAPLPIGEGVDPEVEEEGQLVLLPEELGGGGRGSFLPAPEAEGPGKTGRVEGQGGERRRPGPEKLTAAGKGGRLGWDQLETGLGWPTGATWVPGPADATPRAGLPSYLTPP